MYSRTEEVPDFLSLLVLDVAVVKMAEAAIRSHADVRAMEETRRACASLVIPIHFVVRARSRERTRGFVVAVPEILHREMRIIHRARARPAIQVCHVL